LNYIGRRLAGGRRPIPAILRVEDLEITNSSKQQFGLAGRPLNAVRLPCVVE